MQSWRTDVQKKIAEFKEELGDYGKCLRLSALYEQLFDLDKEILCKYAEYAKIMKNDGAYIDRTFIARPIPALENKVKILEMQIRCIVNEKSLKNNTITPEMILHAREYPITELLNWSGKGNIKCIAHEDRHPSMGIKNNRARCFACGFSGDAIDIKMKIENIDFVNAVKSLQ